MTTLTILIVVAFVLGYACIATESLLKVNKAAIALLMFVACWTLYMFCLLYTSPSPRDRG